MTPWTTWIWWIIGAYVAGSLPFGLWIGWARGVDIRTFGSGNVGATNVGRALGKKWGLLCFFLDVAKGALPTALYGLETMQHAGTSATGALQWMLVGTAAVLGHIFSFWLKFRGGKGVATGLGVVLGVWPVLSVAAVVCGVAWFVLTKATGYVSLASVVAAMLLPIAVFVSGILFGLPLGPTVVYTAICALLGGLVILRHRTNITRLRQGTETKVAWAKRGSA